MSFLKFCHDGGVIIKIIDLSSRMEGTVLRDVRYLSYCTVGLDGTLIALIALIAPPAQAKYLRILFFD